MYLNGAIDMDFLGTGKSVNYTDLSIFIDESSIVKMTVPAGVYCVARVYSDSSKTTELSQIPVNLAGYADSTDDEIIEAALDFIKGNIFTDLTIEEKS